MALALTNRTETLSSRVSGSLDSPAMQTPTPLSVASLTPQSARDVRGANSEWSALAASAANGAFAGPDAVGAYLDAFAPDSVLLRIDVHRQRELIGTLPLIRERRSFHGLPVRTLRVPLRSNARIRSTSPARTATGPPLRHRSGMPSARDVIGTSSSWSISPRTDPAGG